MASLSSYLPQEGSAVWRRDRSPDPNADSQTVRHVVIRSTEVVSEPSPHVIYRIDVLTEHSHWYVCRRYSEFHDLHRKLIRRCKINKELLPPKKLSGNFSNQLIKQRKQQLEQYLQKLINSETHISQASELLSFLDAPAHDVTKVAELLARQLYMIGDKLLEAGTPIALTINDLYCITKRLRLPVDPEQTTDPSADLGHLYGFLHQIVSLKVILPPQPSSVTRMAFEITHFKSLEILKIEEVPLTQVSGMARVQQQLKKLSIHHTLKSLRELLVDSVEERRSGIDSKQFTESWRLVATAKFTSNRVVIQPWNNLVTLNISHNKITCLDDSLQVLPALKELNVSHNFLVHLDLQHLCLPFLTHVNLSHNHITTVNSRSLVIESVKNLNLADNGVFDLSFLCAFVGVHTININNNRVSSKRELDFVVVLKSLKSIYLKGNPLMVTGAARIVLMAKFHLNSKLVAIDGVEPTSGEQNRIHQQIKRHGTDVDIWPVARSLKVQNSPSARKSSQVESPSPAPSSPPSVRVSWTIESLKKPFRPNDSPSHSVTGDNSSVESFDNPLFSDSPISTNRTLKHSSLLISRDEPDGRSDISVDPSDSVISTSTPLLVATPPCTPLSIGGDDIPIIRSNVSPYTISAALEALSTNLSSTPSEESQLPCLLTQALNDFLSTNSSKCATPPSTPQDHDDYAATQPPPPVSATDLISAISSTLSAHCESVENLSSNMSSGAPSVPFGTPLDTVGGGGLAELSRIGIQPESLLSALNKIRGNKNNDQLVEVQSDSNDEDDDSKEAAGMKDHADNETVDIMGEMSMVDLMADTRTEDEDIGDNEVGKGSDVVHALQCTPPTVTMVTQDDSSVSHVVNLLNDSPIPIDDDSGSSDEEGEGLINTGIVAMVTTGEDVSHVSPVVIDNEHSPPVTIHVETDVTRVLTDDVIVHHNEHVLHPSELVSDDNQIEHIEASEGPPRKITEEVDISSQSMSDKETNNQSIDQLQGLVDRDEQLEEGQLKDPPTPDQVIPCNDEVIVPNKQEDYLKEHIITAIGEDDSNPLIREDSGRKELQYDSEENDEDSTRIDDIVRGTHSREDDDSSDDDSSSSGGNEQGGLGKESHNDKSPKKYRIVDISIT